MGLTSTQQPSGLLAGALRNPLPAGTDLKIPLDCGYAYRFLSLSSPRPHSETVPLTTSEMLNVLIRSSETTSGAPVVHRYCQCTPPGLTPPLLLGLGVLTDDDLVDVAAGKDAEAALVQVHDWQVHSSPLSDILIGVQANQQEVCLLPGKLQWHSKKVKNVSAASPVTSAGRL